MEDLEMIGINDLFTLLCRQLMSPLRVAEATSLGGNLNTNNFPFLEYQAPRVFFLDAQATLHKQFDERNRTLINSDLELRSYLEGRAPTREELANSVEYFQNSIGMLTRLRASAAAAWLDLEPDAARAVEEAVQTGYLPLKASLEQTAVLFGENPDDSSYIKMYADALLEVYDLTRTVINDAGSIADRLREVLPAVAGLFPLDRKYYLYRLSQILYDQRMYEQAAEGFKALAGLMSQEADVPIDPRIIPDYLFTYMGRALLSVGQRADALQAFKAAFENNPENSVAAFYYTELSREVAAGGSIDPRQ
jgi:tetratricopeptide (TPR) repeat protein